jgi:hypothetical protein
MTHGYSQTLKALSIGNEKLPEGSCFNGVGKEGVFSQIEIDSIKFFFRVQYGQNVVTPLAFTKIKTPSASVQRSKQNIERNKSSNWIIKMKIVIVNNRNCKLIHGIARGGWSVESEK